jgi:hypothetical protein
MLTLSNLLTEYTDVTNDSSTANQNRAKRRFNQEQKRLCALKEFWWLRESYTLTTVADQHEYQLPARLRRTSSVRVKVGNIEYPVEEIQNPRAYDQLRGFDGVDYSSDYPHFYYIEDSKILFYPQPSTNGNDILIRGLKEPLKMTLEDYSTGTIAVTNGSATITGTGTSWDSTNAKPGAYLIVDDIPYEILTVDSGTEITLLKTFEGSTDTGLSYVIGDAPTIPEDFQDLLWLKAAIFHLGLKKNDRKALEALRSEYTPLLADYLLSSNSPTTQNVWSPRRMYYDHPNNYPTDIG